MIIFQLALCGYAAFLLSYRVCFDEKSSYVALFIFELSPHLLGQAYNGISETVCAGWFPLTIWALLGVLQNQQKISIVAGFFKCNVCVEQLVLRTVRDLGFSSFRHLVLSTSKWLYDWSKISKNILVALVISGSLIIFPFLFFKSLYRHQMLLFDEIQNL